MIHAPPCTVSAETALSVALSIASSVATDDGGGHAGDATKKIMGVA